MFWSLTLVQLRAAVVGAEDAALGGFHQGPHALRIGRRNGDADAPEHAVGQAGRARDIGPGVAAVGGFEQAAAGAAAIEVIGIAAHLPEAGVEHARIGGVHGEIDRAGVGAAREDLLPGLAAIGGAVDAAHFVRPPEMAQRGDVDDVGILGMHADGADGLAVLEARHCARSCRHRPTCKRRRRWRRCRARRIRPCRRRSCWGRNRRPRWRPRSWF